MYLRDVAEGKAWGAPEQRPVLDDRDCRLAPPIQVMRAGEIDIRKLNPVLHSTHGFLRASSAFSAMKATCPACTSSAGKIASTGHSRTQMSQSIHSSVSMTRKFGPS